MKKTLGMRIAEYRKAKGIKQDELAEKLGVSAQAVSKWENDVSCPDIMTLPALSKLLGVTSDELLTGESAEESQVTYLPEEKRKDFEKMMLYVRVDSEDGDKVRVNLPLPLVKVFMDAGASIGEMNIGVGNMGNLNIDWHQIMTLIEKLVSEKTQHGEILIGFTPDEEIGEGADNFDVSEFGADFAYTVDGGAEGSLEFENFNAASASVSITGRNVHPGSAKNTMINASLVAMEFNSALPSFDIPSATEGYEGFYHLTDMKGTVESAELDYIVRDHDAQRFAARLDTLAHIEKLLNGKYGDGTVKLTVTQSYRNMREKILPVMHLIDNARAAIEATGLTPSVEPIRGGTDGARLSFMGLPCPNLGTGGYAFHGPFEHITVEGMDYAVEILANIVKIYAK